ncbi:MAG: winged helix-turn-helix transcriptional regulator [Solirubrobacteraceae bacterium]
MTEPDASLWVMLGRDYAEQDCALARALEVVGERWTLLILRDAFYGVRRFNDFHAHLDIPKAVLSDRLSSLVADGVLDRVPDPEHGGRYLYELTPSGRELWPALHALTSWGSRHRQPNSRVFLHAPCDALLDDEGRCSNCGRTPGPDEIVTRVREGRKPRRTDPVAVALRAPHHLLEPLET